MLRARSALPATTCFPTVTVQSFQRNNKDPMKLTLSNPFPDALAKLDGVNNAAGYELHPPAQYLQSWNLTVEHEVLSSVALELAYVGSKGTHLGRKYNYNQPYRSLELQLPGGGFPGPFHPNLDLPVIAVNAVNVGTITSSGNGRTMQFALKYMF